MASIKEIISSINKENVVLSESSSASYGRPERLSMWNMTRSRLAPVMATIPLDNPQGYIFGKARKISDKSALEFSRDGLYFSMIELGKTYQPGEVFQVAQGVFEAVEEIKFAQDTSDFELQYQVETALARGKIKYHMVESTFSVQKLLVTAYSTYTKTEITQELLQDIESAYAIDLVKDALVSSAAERMNKEMVRFMLHTAAKDSDFEVSEAKDYKDARTMARRIQEAASKITQDTGNIANWVMCSPNVYALLSTSGLLDNEFLGDLEVIKDMYFAPKDKEYFLVGFVHEADDSDHNGDQLGKFEVGSYVLTPYVEDFHKVLATESMSSIQGSQLRYSISVAPYGDMEKDVKSGDNMELHAGKNTNARLVDVVFK